MRELLRRIAYIVRHRRVDADVDEELEFHRAMKQRELEASGLDPAAARLAAQRALGNDLAARERARDVWVAPWLRDAVQDIHFAGRLLIKDRSFTLVAVIALGLGIGVNHTMFSIVNAFCIRGLPIEAADHVVFISTRDTSGRGGALSYPEFEDIRASMRSTVSLAAYVVAPGALRDEGRPADRVVAAYVSPATFTATAVSPMRGRDFHASDDVPGAAPVVILGASVWRQRYGSDEAILGRRVFVNGVAAAVIGVMPDRFGFPNDAEVWLPLAASPALAREARGARALAVIGRLDHDATLVQARAEIEAIGERLGAEQRETNTGVRLEIVPINERFVAQLTHPAWLAFLTAGLVVVLIACANVANLLLSRSVARAREIAIRAAIGATRFRVVRQLLVESTLLALLGGAMGYLLSLAGLRVMEAAIPAAARAYWLDFSMDARAFSVLAVVCLGAVFVFGLVPALHVSKTDPLAVLHEGGRGAVGGVRVRRWTGAFLTAELALTMVLLSGVGGTAGKAAEERRADNAIDPSPILTMMVSLPADKYPTPERRLAFYEAFGERVHRINPVTGFAVATSLPLAGAPARKLEIEGRPASPGSPLTVRTVTVSDDYFATLGLRMVAGRTFDARDGGPGRSSTIVNERFARLMFADASPIGRRIRLNPSPAGSMEWVTIVGVSPTIRQRSDIELDPIVYLPHRSEPPVTTALIVRSSADPATVGAQVREELRAIDPDLPVYRLQTLERAMSEAIWPSRVSMWIITTIASIAACLSIVGLYAVTVHAVSQRRQELGVRLALGATSRDVRWLVIRRAMSQIVTGLAAGIVATYGWDRLFGLGRWSHPVTVMSMAGALALVAIAACLVPASRAARLDPVVALRAD